MEFAKGNIKLICADNLKVMSLYPANYFDLAVIDPPYGIDMSQELYKRGQSCKNNGYKEHLNKDWDKNIPDYTFFKELFRVSKKNSIDSAVMIKEVNFSHEKKRIKIIKTNGNVIRIKGNKLSDVFKQITENGQYKKNKIS